MPVGVVAPRRAADQHVPSIVRRVIRDPGHPLDASTRAMMEPRFKHDFSRVRVHTDTRAAESAATLHALAYTVNNHIVFGAGGYAPLSQSGQQLLVHELAHVTQGGPTATSNLPTHVVPPTSAAEREANAVAEASGSGSSKLGVSTAIIDGLARADEKTPSSTSSEVIDVGGAKAGIEGWQQGLASSTAESHWIVKGLAFVPFFLLELLRRAVQLGDTLFGVTSLQNAADIIFEPSKALWDRIKAGMSAAFTVAMSLLMIGGIESKFVDLLKGLVKWGSELRFVAALRGEAVALVEEALQMARQYLPTFTRLAEIGKALIRRGIETVANSQTWAKMLQWSRKRIPLPSPIEALSEDIGVTMRKLLGRESEQAAASAGAAATAPVAATATESVQATVNRLAKQYKELLEKDPWLKGWLETIQNEARVAEQAGDAVALKKAADRAIEFESAVHNKEAEALAEAATPGNADELDKAWKQASVPRVTGGKRPRIDEHAVATTRAKRMDLENIPKGAGEKATQAAERVREVIGKKLSDVPELKQAWERARQTVLSKRTLTAENYGDLYDMTRNQFWKEVRNDPTATRYFTDRGFMLPDDSPYKAARLAGVDASIRKAESLTSLDHVLEKAQKDNWQYALDADNLRMEFAGPNTAREISQVRNPELRQ